MPLAHKDMFDRKGKIASWGAKIRADKPADEDATAIARYKSAGALQIAALHLTEFAYGPTGHNYVLGHARNPWDPTRITGGSSGGTAAAVAYGAIPAGLGSDTGGSLRVPAACCGVDLDQADLGPHQPRRRHAAGAAARHGRRHRPARRGPGADAGPSRRPRSRAIRPRPPLPVPDYVARLDDSVQGLRVGLDEKVIGEAHPDVQRMVEQVLGILGKLGLKRAPCAFPDWQTLDHLVQLVQLPDAAAAPRRLPAHARRTTTARRCARALEVGHFIPAVDHLTALRARGTYVQRTLDETFKDIDIAILPILADPLPTIAELDVGGGPKRAGGHGARRQVHAAHQLPRPADPDAAGSARRRAAQRHPARSAGRSRRPSCLRSARPISAKCRRRSRGRFESQLINGIPSGRGQSKP